ncbi:MAG: hypothetical protein MZV64_58945 [Ignavibacteriales bacterium]|nr:hypothetical protein [Ignavibacteriales bacterium]
MSSNSFQYRAAIHDFQSARQRASIQEVLARITGKSTRLLSYEEVAGKLKLQVRTERGLQDIPLDAIVGSVGRYTDFTRTFLPRRMDDQQRWVGVRAAMERGGVAPHRSLQSRGGLFRGGWQPPRLDCAAGGLQNHPGARHRVPDQYQPHARYPTRRPDRQSRICRLPQCHPHPRNAPQRGSERHVLLSIRQIDGTDPCQPVHFAGTGESGRLPNGDGVASGRRRILVRHDVHSTRRGHSRPGPPALVPRPYHHRPVHLDLGEPRRPRGRAWVGDPV